MVYDFRNQDTSERYDIVRNYFEGKVGADILELDIIWMEEAISKDRLRSLDSFFEQDMGEYHFLPITLDAAKESYSAKLYGIPLYVDVGLVFYRKDLLGNLPDSVTLDDLEDAINSTLMKMDKKGIEGFIFQSAQYEGLNCLFLELMSSKNISIVDDYGKIHLNSDSVKTAIEQVHDAIYKSGIVPPSVLVFKEKESRDLFTCGRALVARNWPFVLQSWEKSSKIPLNHIGVTNFGKPVLGGSFLGIMKDTKHPKESWEVIKFLIHPNRQFKRATSDNESWRRIPPDMEVLSNLRARFPLLSNIELALQKAVPRPRLQNYQHFSNALSKALFEILSRADAKQKIGEILDKAQKEFEGMMLRLDLYVKNPNFSAQFYNRILGFEKVREKRLDTGYSISLRNGNVNLALISRVESQQQRMEFGGEIVLEVGDIYPLYQRVVGHEYVVDSTLRSQTLGLTDFWLSDPDGHSIRVTAR